jgi:hypothetical protein
VSVEQLIGIITGSTGVVGVLAIFITLILSGKLHTEGEFDRVAKALELEKEAHAETTRALAAASERADAAVRASELIAEAFSASSTRRKNVTPHVPPRT